MKKTNWVMDYETLKDCFVGVFIDYKSKNRQIFVISDLKDDREEFYNFLKRNIDLKEWHISFNGLSFDAQITHWYLDNYDKLKDLNPGELANKIYKYAQTVIYKKDVGEYLDYYEKSFKINQLDVFKLNHWDSKAKSSSLKWIEFSINWDNLLDMPIHHSQSITNKKELNLVIDYCINDVEATKEIFNISRPQIELRKRLSKLYNINLYNASEPTIGKKILSKLLGEDLNIPEKRLKKLRTYRNLIKVSDLILPYINFKSEHLKRVHEYFNKLIVYPPNLKGVVDYSFNQGDVSIAIGLGGIHGATRQGVYESDDKYIIMSSDVKSYYPNLMIQNKWAPAHLDPDVFCNRYEWFYIERGKYPKSDPINYVYKIILNSSFGLSNDENSFLYDPELTLKITINGQLSLLMLQEEILSKIPGSQLLLLNTDGLEIRIPRKYKEKYMEICDEWCNRTKLILEHDSYKKIILSDVNSYIAVKDYKEVSKEEFENINSITILKKQENDKYYISETKCIGRFELEGIALHKNKSNLVSRIAVFNYFLKDIPVEKTIFSHKNFYDFLIGVRAKAGFEFIERKIEQGELKERKLQKTNRYYVSKSNSVIIKVKKIDGSETKTESGWQQREVNYINNVVIEDSFKDIDYRYYIRESYKEINNILSNNQLKLLI